MPFWKRAVLAAQTVSVGVVLVLCLRTMAGSVRLDRAAVVGAAVLADPAAALAAANAAWTPRPALPAAAPQSPSPTQSPLPAPPEPTAAPATPLPSPPPTPLPTVQSRPAGWGVLETAFYPQGSGPGYLRCGAGSIKNCTSLPDEELAEELACGLPFHLQKNSKEPQILILHTHTTETYNLQSDRYFDPEWGARTTDPARNMCAVGAALAKALNEGGFVTLQDCTLHDYPSYNGSYAASNATARAYLEKYPTLRVILDVHRDAIEREGTRVKPTAQIDGRSAAQIMLICGCDRGGNLPNFRQNLRFAAAFEAQMEQDAPGLTRPVLFDYRYYNQDLCTGSLLMEVGGHGNSLEEAVYSARLAGQALARLFKNA